MKKDASIYIAGHNGLVGSALLRKLQSEGYDHLILRTHGELDLTDQQAVNRFFEKEKPEYVFLAAAKVGGILANATYPADFIYQNLAIQNAVIHQSFVHNVKKLIFLGSSCIYPKYAPQPMKEEHLLTGELEPTNQWYAVAKIAGIKMCQAYARQHGLNTLSLMPTNLYGPGDNYDLETSHVLPALIRKFHLAGLAREGDFEAIGRDEQVFGPIPEDIRESLGLTEQGRASLAGNPVVRLWGTGSPRREFLHVDDLADAALFLMDHYESDEIINVGAGQDVEIRELARIVKEVVGFEGDITFDTSKPDGTPRKLLDVSKITKLGWKPKIGLREGIKQTYEAYREELKAMGHGR